jgi:hypothetical protein
MFPRIAFTVMILIAPLANSNPAAAQVSYDWRTGNNYSTTHDSFGSTTNGFNSNTGSVWSQRNNNNGTYSGHDSNGNFYSGNNNNGFYQNFGTGRTCVGQGYARVCN